MYDLEHLEEKKEQNGLTVGTALISYITSFKGHQNHSIIVDIFHVEMLEIY